jgi:hypothetical protein
VKGISVCDFDRTLSAELVVPRKPLKPIVKELEDGILKEDQQIT